MIHIHHWLQGQETKKIREFFIKHWHDNYIVAHGTVYRPEDLEALVILANNSIQGLLTFTTNSIELEIITLDSLTENQGIGSTLLETLEQEAIKRNFQRLRVITTNDNLKALGFYQRRGFQMIDVVPNAVEKSRSIKPSIPLLAENGIPIRDEIVLKKQLSFQPTQDGDLA